MRIAQGLGLRTRALKVDIDDLGQLPLPCILHWNLDHFVVLKSVKTSRDRILAVEIHDPAVGALSVSYKLVSDRFTGIVLEVEPDSEFKTADGEDRLTLRKMAASATDVKGGLLRIFLAAVALECTAIASPYMLQLTVDHALSRDASNLTILAAAFGAVVLLQAAFGALRSWTVVFVSSKIQVQWLGQIFYHTLHLPISFFVKRSFGDLVSRFRSVQVIQQTLSTSLVEAMLDGLLLIALYSVMCFYSVTLAAVAFGAVIAYALVRVRTFKALYRLSAMHVAADADQQGAFMESLRGIQALKLFGEEHARYNRWYHYLVHSVNRDADMRRAQIGINSCLVLLSGLENVVIVFVGASMVAQGNFTMGMLTAFLAYKAIGSNRAAALIDKFVAVKMLDVHVDRLDDILTHPREGNDEPSSSDALPSGDIELDAVSFRYSDTDPWLLKDVSIRFYAGESVAITGSSGCGKTTLLKILCGVLQPTVGVLRIGGHEVGTYGLKRYRRQIAAVMQDDTLFTGTIEENITFFQHDASSARVEECAVLASIDEEIEELPMGYATQVGEMGVALSGGQKQRVLLARALYRCPRVLVLDEATSHLDIRNEQRINEALARLQMTRIIVAHREESIRSTDRIVTMENGFISSDTRDQVKRAWTYQSAEVDAA
jgi:ATP-binding cassette subfamily B protein RaxB